MASILLNANGEFLCSLAPARRPGLGFRDDGWRCQLTPSFFCSEEDEVVYWNRSFLPGYTIL